MDGLDDEFEVAVVGAGIAGASVAAELAEAGAGRVALLEMEAQPGYHTTGRSAAVFAPTYGPAPIRALTRASAAFYEAPPEGFAAHPLLSPRPIMQIARPDQAAALEALLREISGETEVAVLDEAQLRRACPLVREGYAQAAMLDEAGRDIDVAALHQGCLRRFGARGGVLLVGAEVMGLRRERGRWRLSTRAGEIRARVVVDAAGAWAEEVGRRAGAEPIGLRPKRRTALIVAAPEGVDAAPFPLTVDVEETFYLKPDAGRLLLSPADETPAPPGDARPEEIDVALCVDRIERAFELRVRRIEGRWAGLRSFVADKSPVAGFSRDVEGFYWLAGQGGYGIQSAPALARLAAAQVMGRPVPPDILDQGLDPADLSPARLKVPA